MQIKVALLTFGAFFIIVIASQEKVYTKKCDFANIRMLQLFSINRPVKSKICATSTTTLPTTTTTTTTTACTSEPSLVPLNRLSNSAAYRYFFTTSLSEVSAAMAANYMLDTPPGLVATSASDCLCGASFKPVHRLFKEPNNLYTSSETDVNNATTMGYVDKGTFYCADQLNFCGATIPLYSYERDGEHFLTVNATADDYFIEGSKLEGTTCYIWPAV